MTSLMTNIINISDTHKIGELGPRTDSLIYLIEKYAMQHYNQNIYMSADGEKSTFEFIGLFREEPFTLYDWKDSNEIHIGGTDNTDIAALRAHLNQRLNEYS